MSMLMKQAKSGESLIGCEAGYSMVKVMVGPTVIHNASYSECGESLREVNLDGSSY